MGVAPGTKLYAAKVLAANGGGAISQVICGIDWVTGTRTDADPDNDIEVANMSLGGIGAPVEPCATTTDPQHRAICASTAAGVTYVVAAGNECWEFDYGPAPATPAAYPEVLTVSAMGDSDGRAAVREWLRCARAERPTTLRELFELGRDARGQGSCDRGAGRLHPLDVAALCIEEGGRAGPCADRSPAEIVKMRADAAGRAAAEVGSGFAGRPQPATVGTPLRLPRVGIH